MLNFDYEIPTKILFGKDKIKQLGSEIKKYGNRILLLYGGGSIKKIGLYNDVKRILKDNAIEFQELGGVQPNPRITIVREGIRLCREHQLDFILAVGGGSVLDTAKAIAAGFYYQGDAWDFYTRKASVKKALPIGTILTLAATGSEMNGNSVINDEATESKLAIGSLLLYPKFSILDPVYTFSLPPEQTAAGVVDIMSHIFEQYFSPEHGTAVQDRLAEALLKVCIHYGPIVLAEPQNYEARANILWAGSLALNGLLSYGKTGDWATHNMEHELSAIYDLTHGVGLALLTPFWMEYVLSERTVDKFADYAQNVWGIISRDKFAAAHQAIDKTREFFKSIGMPVTLREVGIDDQRLDEMSNKAVRFGALGNFKRLNSADVLQIFKNAL
ncbi:iron-containing alcohol dehydrogenase [candidate division KSB1 bacterium]|nr:iron-containing alcohol dehydrogenase [candidate division KSB1 bacterium]